MNLMANTEILLFCCKSFVVDLLYCQFTVNEKCPGKLLTLLVHCSYSGGQTFCACQIILRGISGPISVI